MRGVFPQFLLEKESGALSLAPYTQWGGLSFSFSGEGMWKELEVVGYRANRMQCSHVHGGFLQGFGTPLAFCLGEVLVCVGGIFQVLDIAMRPDRFPAVNTMKRGG